MSDHTRILDMFEKEDAARAAWLEGRPDRDLSCAWVDAMRETAIAIAAAFVRAGQTPPSLSERNWAIVKACLGGDETPIPTQKAVAAQFGISSARVAQIVRSSLRRLHDGYDRHP